MALQAKENNGTAPPNNKNDNDNDNNNNPPGDGEQPYTEYRNNADKVLNFRIDATATATTCHEQIQEIVEVLCPFLLLSDNNNDDRSGSSSSIHLPFQIKPLTGGLSNHLFLVSNDSNSTVLVRIHPDANETEDDALDANETENETTTASTSGTSTNTFSIVDRDSEPKFAAWLASQQLNSSSSSNSSNNNNSNANLAPTVYGRFLNGRVEEFYDNVRPLAWAEMKRYAPWIAQRLASFHSLGGGSSSNSNSCSNSCSSSGNDEITTAIDATPPPPDVLPRPTTSAATVYEMLESWFHEARATSQKREATAAGNDANDSNNNDDDDADEMVLFLNQLSSEWAWLEKELTNLPPPLQQQQSTTDDDDDKSIVAEALSFIRRVTVTHMDCQPLNILIGNNYQYNDYENENIAHGSDNQLRLIDFEYAGWNPIAADIANTFCEYCEMSNLCADYDKEYPTPAQQDVFFWNYLLHSDPIRAKKFSSYSRRTMQQMKTETQNPGVSSNRNDDDDDKEWNLFSTTLQQEVGRFSLLSHLGWAVWSILKRQEQDGVDFDYMAYARHRMDGYAWAKKRFIVVAAGEATATAAS
uniref:Uncharacterized protein n=1 Tax=Pseudo-nitzschia australis TaxID=44445 RepID=A0A7S4AF06_9STRA|mmetsp:Transcript_3404/g.7326  ORF Transcript_3404/g.7326 Transcript_3404/m.7326 type:complete len:585 (-) Transcript_3404:306-2060(-)|eukprot:CAMPEP_0168177154 /NCGR_PEP_ID=MMETSP0139_2-20121125/8271_1 /TAXON_ID=44445 /ORGANISM="Pseudo-nitzschia australis, Strain 10249 10 AB" /LENGTH=584 /DNA_ID=CAMNT_0008096123 /DNA_START=196 /DNA_END=1950 /DNA_ORIENTATION=+